MQLMSLYNLVRASDWFDVYLVVKFVEQLCQFA